MGNACTAWTCNLHRFLQGKCRTRTLELPRYFTLLTFSPNDVKCKFDSGPWLVLVAVPACVTWYCTVVLNSCAGLTPCSRTGPTNKGKSLDLLRTTALCLNTVTVANKQLRLNVRSMQSTLRRASGAFSHKTVLSLWSGHCGTILHLVCALLWWKLLGQSHLLPPHYKEVEFHLQSCDCWQTDVISSSAVLLCWSILDLLQITRFVNIVICLH